MVATIDRAEAFMPRSEQIPGETHHPNERVRAIIFEVKPQGSRVKVVLSRTRPQLVQRLFEQEIPEIVDGVIEVRAMAREPGYRSKVAVSSSDQRVDCVGACVGVRGNRIKNIVDELNGEGHCPSTGTSGARTRAWLTAGTLEAWMALAPVPTTSASRAWNSLGMTTDII
mgnify:CR=1 FL=1